MQNKLLDGDLVKGIRPAMQVTQLFSLVKKIQKENIPFSLFNEQEAGGHKK